MSSEAKTALRQWFRADRRAFVGGLSAEQRRQLEANLAVIAAPRTAAARIPASYAARGPELDPFAIEKQLPPHAFPRVSGNDLFFHLSEWSALAPGFGGIPEPAPSTPLVTPDLVLVPLLAATRDGRRLGQGGGFYDRALRRLRATGTVVAIGLAWDMQLTDDLPFDSWDERLDHIATPTRLVDCAAFR